MTNLMAIKCLDSHDICLVSWKVNGYSFTKKSHGLSSCSEVTLWQSPVNGGFELGKSSWMTGGQHFPMGMPLKTAWKPTNWCPNFRHWGSKIRTWFLTRQGMIRHWILVGFPCSNKESGWIMSSHYSPVSSNVAMPFSSMMKSRARNLNFVRGFSR